MPAQRGTQESEASQETPSARIPCGGRAAAGAPTPGAEVPLGPPRPASESRLAPLPWEGPMVSSLLSFIPCCGHRPGDLQTSGPGQALRRQPQLGVQPPSPPLGQSQADPHAAWQKEPCHADCATAGRPARRRHSLSRVPCLPLVTRAPRRAVPNAKAVSRGHSTDVQSGARGRTRAGPVSPPRAQRVPGLQVMPLLPHAPLARPPLSYSIYKATVRQAVTSPTGDF